jgi:hypothetical protein
MKCLKSSQFRKKQCWLDAETLSPGTIRESGINQDPFGDGPVDTSSTNH